MSFNVSSLADYTKQNAQNLVVSAVLGAKTAQLIKAQGNVMPGIKSSETINAMDTDAIFQDGASCGWNASGSTAFSQRTLTVGKIKVQEALCQKTLETKYLQEALPAGGKYDSLVFAEKYSTRKAEKIAAQLEVALWAGDTGSANVNLNKFDGLSKIIAAASASVIHANTAAYIGTPITTGTGITSGNVISIVDAVYKAIPAEIVDKPDTVIVCGTDVFRTYTIALKNANLFAYTYDGSAQGELTIPGTTIKLVALQGLNGSSKLYSMSLSNVFLGTDLLNEEEQFSIFYAQEAMEMRFAADFKLGVQIAFPSQVVDFILA